MLTKALPRAKIQGGEELQFARIEGLLQSLQKQATEQAGEHAHRQERTPVGRRSIGCRPATARRRAPHNAGGVMQEVLSPGVEHGEEADLGPQMFGIGGDASSASRTVAEQDARRRLRLFWKAIAAISCRHGEDHVKIWDVQKLGLPVLDPVRAGQRLAFGAMPIAAAVVRDSLDAALIALFEMAAERGRAAHLDGRHDASLCRGHRRAMLLSIGFSVAAEHVRHFQLRTLHGPAAQKC